MKNQRERTEDQYLDYGARMRRERDAALKRIHEIRASHDPAKWPLNEGDFYVCRWCGYHPNNRAEWCGAGCGSDYNHMFRVHP